jgi:hypothetical protein
MLLYLRGIEAHLAQWGAPHGSGLGQYRWVVERTLSWLHPFRRLRVRYERRADIHEGFLSLGCALISWNLSTTWVQSGAAGYGPTASPSSLHCRGPDH